MVNISAIVLAAGLSQRMGDNNKLFLDFKGKPLVAHVIDQVAQSNVHQVILVTSEISIEKIQALEIGDSQIIINPDYQRGMTTSIQAGIENSSDKNEGYMICLGDLPLIQTETFNFLIESFSEEFRKNKEIITIPTFQGKKGNPVIFSSAYRDKILAHTEPEGCRGIIEEHQKQANQVKVSDPGILNDVDTEEDYIQLIG